MEAIYSDMGKNKLTDMILVVVFTTFMGQIYFTPFGTDFRVTFAVAFLSIFMLAFRNLKPFITINLIGISMMVVRSAVFVLNQNGNILDALSAYYPMLFFYLLYSLLFVYLDVRKFLFSPTLLFLSLWLCDVIPNILEAIIRQEWKNIEFERIVFIIVVIALSRTVFTMLVINIMNFYVQNMKEKELRRQFNEKLIMMSSLKTELFFLRKSQNDIEDAMRRSYSIYEKTKDYDDKMELLSIAKDIHEIKKDYSRVIAGIEKSTQESSNMSMSFENILGVVVESNRNLSQQKNKKIDFLLRNSIYTEASDYYSFISIINNLIVNSIEAIKESGSIRINSHYISEETIRIIISDSGPGIEESDLDLIFQPGFSTKYNEANGIMSSGIGLTHVKYLIDTMGGNIEVSSRIGIGTEFVVDIPKSKLIS